MFLSSRDVQCFKRLGKNFLKDWIQFLRSIVVIRLFVVTSQSTNDRRGQTLRLDSNQLAFMREKLCTERVDLHHFTRRCEESIMRVLELNVSPNFALMEQVVLDINSAQSTVSFGSGSIAKNFFDVRISSYDSSKANKYFVRLFLNESLKSKFTP